MTKGAVVSVERVAKKYCRSLQHSLRYGIADFFAELGGQDGTQARRLRPAEFFALDDVSFELGRGECLGLLGANGAGKSTLLKMMNGIVRPDAGQITIRGRVGALIELGTGFSPILTGRENVYVNGALLGFAKKEIDRLFEQIVEFAGLGEFIDTPVHSYSTGMHMRLAMAVAAHLQADCLLVDEVLAVGDIAFRMKCFQHFLDLKRAGKTIIIVSHNMIDITRVCNRVIVLDGGKTIYEGGVATGIATYEESLAKRSRAEDQRAEAAPALIDHIKLLDETNRPCTEFHTGNNLFAEVTLKAERHVSNARLIVHVLTPSLGLLGAFASPHNGFTFDIEPEGTVVRFAIRNLPLLIGSYSLRLYLYGPSIKDFYQAVNQAAVFKVVCPPVDAFGYGVCHTIHFDHHWRLGSGNESDDHLAPARVRAL
jgi:lipopolysaccharide transport system ATP-binding protein